MQQVLNITTGQFYFSDIVVFNLSSQQRNTIDLEEILLIKKLLT